MKSFHQLVETQFVCSTTAAAISLLLSCFVLKGSGRPPSSWHQSEHPGMSHLCFCVCIWRKVRSLSECRGGRSREGEEKWHVRGMERERGRAVDVEDENLEMIVLEQKIWSKLWQSRAHMPWESSTHDECTHQRAKLRQARNRLGTLFPSQHPVFPLLILATLQLH